MLPREIFETLHAEIAILVLFEHFLGKHCLIFLTLILSSLLHQTWCFCSHIFNHACLRR